MWESWCDCVCVWHIINLRRYHYNHKMQGIGQSVEGILQKTESRSTENRTRNRRGDRIRNATIRKQLNIKLVALQAEM